MFIWSIYSIFAYFRGSQEMKSFATYTPNTIVTKHSGCGLDGACGTLTPIEQSWRGLCQYSFSVSLVIAALMH